MLLLVSVLQGKKKVLTMSKPKFNLGSPWEEVKAKLKERNIHLTDEDLEYQQGREDELLKHLSEKMNKSKQEVKEIIESVSFNRGVAG
jgi:uncharacterized protein YjbJ (UPF0337 family)